MFAPFPSRTISTPYGWRVHPERGIRQHHPAIDYRVPGGVAVHAIASGAVSAVRFDRVLGNVVEIDHGAGYVSRYAHLRDPSPLEVGDHVTADSEIGHVGKTGSGARGDHLHLELWHHGRHIDPAHQLTERP
jgi:murein DD-endopeptidase MepM/ murein hydrolase activator NlpD